MSEALDRMLPPPPAGFNHLSVISRDMTMMLMITMLASFCVPALMALLFFTARHETRKTPIFRLNVSILLLGIFQAAYCVGVVSRNLLNPLNELPEGYIIFYYVISFLTPIVVEVVLMLRLSAVFSHPMYRRKRFYIVGVTVFLKVLRVIAAILVLIFWTRGSRQRNVTLSSGLYSWSFLPYPRIGWGLQVLDHGYCSLVFLGQLRRRIRDPKGVLQNGDLLRRLRGVFFLALSNFVFPCVLSLTHLILSLVDAVWDPAEWFYMCNYIMIANNYISIIGVVFATIWATSLEWAAVRGLYGRLGDLEGSGSGTQASYDGAQGYGLRPYRGSNYTKVGPSSPSSPGYWKTYQWQQPVDTPSTATAFSPSPGPEDAEVRHPSLPARPLRIRIEKDRNVLPGIEIVDTSDLKEGLSGVQVTSPGKLNTIPEANSP